MKKLLCFCTICNTMIIAAGPQKIQGKIVSRYVSIIDPHNEILQADRKGNEASLEEKEVTGIKGYDAATISKIVNGKIILKLSGLKIPDNYDDKTIDNLKNVASSWFTEENKRLLIVALRDIIKEDTYIDCHEASFKKYFGMTKEEFLNKEHYDFWELMVQVLFYTILTGIDIGTQNEYLFHNEVSDKKTKDIFKEYIQNLKEEYHELINDCNDLPATLTIRKDGKSTDNSLIITPIIKPRSRSVEEAASTSISSNSNCVSDNIIDETTIAIDEKYMICQYCTRFRDLKDNNNPNMGKCSFSSNCVHKNAKSCISFDPKYGAISTAIMSEKSPIKRW